VEIGKVYSLQKHVDEWSYRIIGVFLMHFRLDYKMSLLILLFVILIITILDNRKLSDSLKTLKADKVKLTEEVVGMEKELKFIEELQNKNKELEDSLYHLGEEITAFKTPVAFQDFMDAKNTLESYKKVNTFEEATKYLARQNGLGFTTLDRESNCPCSISFNGRSVEWLPHVLLELSNFRIEKEKIILTYQTVESLPVHFQFVMIKDIGVVDPGEEKWRIKEILVVDKE
jgi:hypothetical protein